jgi:hypothetical protein
LHKYDFFKNYLIALFLNHKSIIALGLKFVLNVRSTKETKQILEDLNDKSGPIRYVQATVKYYIKNGKTFYPSNNKNSLLAILKDKKNELRMFIRKNELDFFEDFEKSLLRIVDQYELLTK